MMQLQFSFNFLLFLFSFKFFRLGRWPQHKRSGEPAEHSLDEVICLARQAAPVALKCLVQIAARGNNEVARVAASKAIIALALALSRC